MWRTLLVAAGGAMGSVARYWIGIAALQLGGGFFPIGTVTVNLVGSFVLGVAMALSLERGAFDANARVFLTIGFCGGFTTMSTFSYETLALLHDGRVALALANVGVSIPGCVLAAWLGIAAARAL